METEEKPKKKNKKKIKKLTIFCVFADICMIVFLFVVYGPFPQFKEWWITTALETGNHKYFANVLYSNNDITEVMMNNTIDEGAEDTDTSQIVFDNSPKDSYESIYEEQILERDDGNELYKLIRIDEKNYSGYMIVVYDPSRVDLATSKQLNAGGQLLPNLSRDHGAIAAINASGFSKRNGVVVPHATVINNGKVQSVGKANRHGGGLIGFTKDHKLMLTTNSAERAIKDGMWDAVTFGPFLIVNGKSAKISGNGGRGVANRTAIGQRKDGIVLLLVIDGRGADGSDGASIKDLIEIFEKYGAYNAANLDGGGSSTMTINHEVINNPRGFGYTGVRYIPNAWIVK